MSDLRSKPIPVPRGGFQTHEDEAKWLADTIAMRTAEALTTLGLSSVSVPTASLYELLLMGLQSAAKRAAREEKQAHDRRVTELLEANNREAERRREAEHRAELLAEDTRAAQDWYREHEKAIRAAGIAWAPDFMVPF